MHHLIIVQFIVLDFIAILRLIRSSLSSKHTRPSAPKTEERTPQWRVAEKVAVIAVDTSHAISMHTPAKG